MRKLRLVLADVDGTLVTHDKVLTERTKAAVVDLRAHGVAFAITSGRPPRGMQMLIEPLAVDKPLAAFNGGLFVNPDLSIIEQHCLGQDVVEPVVKIMREHQLDVWIYAGNDWFVTNRHGAHVDREEWTVKFPPTVVPDIAGKMNDVAKIVGVSDDLEAVARCERAVQGAFAADVLACRQTNPSREARPAVSAARSQPYYLDVTHPAANKGEVVNWLSARLAIPPEEIATIGDMPNDVAMFRKSGVSIAMGQASDEVKRAATYVTASSEEDGFAVAIERYVLALEQ